jgi:hypothetical protein
MVTTNDMPENALLTPTVLWAQRQNRLFLTLEVPDVKNDELNITESGLSFFGESAEKHYKLSFNFFAPVDESSKKIVKTGQHVCIDLEKKETKWWDRLLKESGKNAWLKTDFSKWVDEDEEEEDDEQAEGAMGMDPYAQMQGMNFGMPGMEGMGMDQLQNFDFSGMGGEEGEEEDSGDEEEEPSAAK